MQDRLKEHIMKQRYLYRGTNTFSFGIRKQKEFYYGTWKPMPTEKETYTTSTSISLLYAMLSGVQRCKTDYAHIEEARPLLVAVKTDNYLGVMRPGIEGTEVEVLGKINFNDVIIIDSLDVLKKIKPDVNDVEIEEFKSSFLQVL